MLPQLQFHLLGASTTTTTAPAAKSSTLTFVVIIALFAAVYFLYIRPRRAKLLAQQREAADAKKNMGVGDKVVTTAGIIGEIRSLDEDRATVEIAPNMIVTFDRRALGQVVESAPESADPWGNLGSGSTSFDQPDGGTPTPPDTKEE